MLLGSGETILEAKWSVFNNGMQTSCLIFSKVSFQKKGLKDCTLKNVKREELSRRDIDHEHSCMRSHSF